MNKSWHSPRDKQRRRFYCQGNLKEEGGLKGWGGGLFPETGLLPDSGDQDWTLKWAASKTDKDHESGSGRKLTSLPQIQKQPGKLASWEAFVRSPAQSLEPLPPSAETVGAASPYFAATALWLSQHAFCPGEPSNCLTARSLFPFLSSAGNCFSSRGRFGKRLPPFDPLPPQLYRSHFEEAPVDGSSANQLLLLPPPRSLH